MYSWNDFKNRFFFFWLLDCLFFFLLFSFFIFGYSLTSCSLPQPSDMIHDVPFIFKKERHGSWGMFLLLLERTDCSLYLLQRGCLCEMIPRAAITKYHKWEPYTTEMCFLAVLEAAIWGQDASGDGFSRSLSLGLVDGGLLAASLHLLTSVCVPSWCLVLFFFF